MKPSFFRFMTISHFPAFTLVILLFASLPARAQQTEDISSRLQQAEATYQLKLREIHTPILKDYLRKLETLQSRLPNPDHLAQVTREAQKIRQLIATTGILPTDVPRKIDPPALPGTDRDRDRARPTLSLQASEAISPVAVTPEARNALPLGSIAWNVTKLPPGKYDVLLVFAAEALTADEPIMLTVGTYQLISHLKPDLVTGGDDVFRIFKLGNLVIDSPIADQTLTLQNGNPTVPRLRIRNVLFVRSSQP
ncbi:hypothetical protein FEM03_04175 [Phragmitibacter flavus]|uniref:Uncharacterized protein n=1 Tax=Phragmitibacter flavus TaxID=2576071 RepID=A0A5R8KJY7_9BACT|nr:hypothetical protein [Phragmitibacter flavus]TLD71929.1 hypothetical protein FEM03_04175 [Phragmitibacter flavus]